MGSEDTIFEVTSREVSIPNSLHSSIALTGSIYASFRKHMESRDIGSTSILYQTISLGKKKKVKKAFLNHSLWQRWMLQPPFLKEAEKNQTLKELEIIAQNKNMHVIQS